MRGKLRDKRTADKRDAFKFKRDARETADRRRPTKQDRGKVWLLNDEDDYEEVEEEEEIEEAVNATPTK
jgi:hypothetical protein